MKNSESDFLLLLKSRRILKQASKHRAHGNVREWLCRPRGKDQTTPLEELRKGSFAKARLYAVALLRTDKVSAGSQIESPTYTRICDPMAEWY